MTELSTAVIISEEETPEFGKMPKAIEAKFDAKLAQLKEKYGDQTVGYAILVDDSENQNDWAFLFLKPIPLITRLKALDKIASQEISACGKILMSAAIRDEAATDVRCFDEKSASGQTLITTCALNLVSEIKMYSHVVKKK